MHSEWEKYFIFCLLSGDDWYTQWNKYWFTLLTEEKIISWEVAVCYERSQNVGRNVLISTNMLSFRYFLKCCIDVKPLSLCGTCSPFFHGHADFFIFQVAILLLLNWVNFSDELGNAHLRLCLEKKEAKTTLSYRDESNFSIGILIVHGPGQILVPPEVAKPFWCHFVCRA